MSSTTNYILYLKSIQKYLYEFGGPILIFVGTMSCILSLTVFTKKNLRKNPCSMYLIAYNIINLILIYSSLLIVTLSLGYSIAPGLQYVTVCRYNLYMAKMLDIVSPSYLVLASFDRMLITSPNTETRQRSTSRLALICIISVTLFWMLFHSHILFLANITQVAPNSYLCFYQSGIESAFISYYTIILKEFIVSLLMIIFGLLVVRNLRRVRRITVPVAFTVTSATGTTIKGSSTSNNSKDRQFFLMLLIDIIVYIIFSSMLSGVHLYEQIIQYNVKSLVETQFNLMIQNVAIFMNYIPVCIGCYTNFFLSKTFRNEIKNIILCK